MGSLTDKIGIGIYNAAIRRRNKLVRGGYHVKDKAIKTATYLRSVGNNVVADVTSEPPSTAFPFKMPENHTVIGQRQQTTKVIHHHHYHENRKSKRRKQRRDSRPHNPYSLI